MERRETSAAPERRPKGNKWCSWTSPPPGRTNWPKFPLDPRLTPPRPVYLGADGPGTKRSRLVGGRQKEKGSHTSKSGAEELRAATIHRRWPSTCTDEHADRPQGGAASAPAGAATPDPEDLCARAEHGDPRRLAQRRRRGGWSGGAGTETLFAPELMMPGLG